MNHCELLIPKLILFCQEWYKTKNAVKLLDMWNLKQQLRLTQRTWLVQMTNINVMKKDGRYPEPKTSYFYAKSSPVLLKWLHISNMISQRKATYYIETNHALIGSARGLHNPSLYLCACFNISFLCKAETSCEKVISGLANCMSCGQS